MTPASLQLLHVAAHLDTLEALIRPRVERGELVLLDRYWWSTWLYGKLNGIDAITLSAMVDFERERWGTLQPTAIFLIRRSADFLEEPQRGMLRRMSAEYEDYAAHQAAQTAILAIENNGPVEQVTNIIVEAIRRMTSETGFAAYRDISGTPKATS